MTSREALSRFFSQLTLQARPSHAAADRSSPSRRQQIDVARRRVQSGFKKSSSEA